MGFPFPLKCSQISKDCICVGSPLKSLYSASPAQHPFPFLWSLSILLFSSVIPNLWVLYGDEHFHKNLSMGRSNWPLVNEKHRNNYHTALPALKIQKLIRSQMQSSFFCWDTMRESSVQWAHGKTASTRDVSPQTQLFLETISPSGSIWSALNYITLCHL